MTQKYFVALLFACYWKHLKADRCALCCAEQRDSQPPVRLTVWRGKRQAKIQCACACVCVCESPTPNHCYSRRPKTDLTAANWWREEIRVMVLICGNLFGPAKHTYKWLILFFKEHCRVRPGPPVWGRAVVLYSCGDQYWEKMWPHPPQPNYYYCNFPTVTVSVVWQQLFLSTTVAACVLLINDLCF